jgi:hypothetical protein
MTLNEKLELSLAVAQLRHAYAHLVRSEEANWHWIRRDEFAKGLLGPQIIRLEKLIEKSKTRVSK